MVGEEKARAMSGEAIIARRVLLPAAARFREVFHFTETEVHAQFEVTRHNPYEPDIILLRTRDSVRLGIEIALKDGVRTTLRLEERYRTTLPRDFELIRYSYDISRTRGGGDPFEFYRFDFHPFERTDDEGPDFQHTDWHVHCSFNKSARLPTPKMNLPLILDFAIRFFRPEHFGRVRVPNSAILKSFDWFDRLRMR